MNHFRHKLTSLREAADPDVIVTDLHVEDVLCEVFVVNGQEGALAADIAVPEGCDEVVSKQVLRLASHRGVL